MVWRRRALTSIVPWLRGNFDASIQRPGELVAENQRRASAGIRDRLHRRRQPLVRELELARQKDVVLRRNEPVAMRRLMADSTLPGGDLGAAELGGLTIPTLVVFLIFQRFIIRGVVMAGLKG